MKTRFYWLAFLGYLLIALLPLQAEVTDFSAFENVPVHSGGRVRSFYTFATESLQRIYGKAVYKDEETGRKLSAEAVLFGILSDPAAWQAKPVVLVSLKELKEEVGLPARKYFSLKELSENKALGAKIEEVAALLSDPTGKPKLDRVQTEVRDLITRIELLHALMMGKALTIVPSNQLEAGWVTPADAPTLYAEKGTKVASETGDLLNAFRSGDNAAFTQAAVKLSNSLAGLNPRAYPVAGILKLETHYGKLHPFSWSWKLLIAAGIVLGLTSLKGRKVGYQIAWLLIAVAFLLQIYGFYCRVMIGGRGPVTNMYESVIWVGFGTILFAIIMEAIYQSRMVFAAAIPVAVISLIIADTQSAVLNPGIDPLEAVLRNNFWLSTHVTSITLGYAAFLLALGVAHMALFKELFRRPVSAALYNYLYRALQIGVLLLAVGTILGAIWANYSWGRFWDWDPKETWALIALLGYIALLHGRIAGWWKGFGLAVGSIFGFMLVVMAWYGVNFVLGEGLHSYGFGAGGLEYAAAYVVAELVFVTIVLLTRGRNAKQSADVDEEEEVEA